MPNHLMYDYAVHLFQSTLYSRELRILLYRLFSQKSTIFSRFSVVS